MNASGTKVKNQAVEKVSITLTILWSLQRSGKNGISDTLQHVQPNCYGIFFLHKKRFVKSRNV